MERKPKVRIIDQTVIELACDADLNVRWANSGGRFLPPRERITIYEALVGGISELPDAGDSTPVSDN